jgi:hypothetical protein
MVLLLTYSYPMEDFPHAIYNDDEGDYIDRGGNWQRKRQRSVRWSDDPFSLRDLSQLSVTYLLECEEEEGEVLLLGTVKTERSCRLFF